MENQRSDRCFLPVTYPTNCFVTELTGVVQLQLGFNPGPISVDRTQPEMEQTADLACATAAPDQLEHFKFAVGQLRDAVFAFSARRNAFQNPRGDLRRHIDFAAQY